MLLIKARIHLLRSLPRGRWRQRRLGRFLFDGYGLERRQWRQRAECIWASEERICPSSVPLPSLVSFCSVDLNIRKDGLCTLLCNASHENVSKWRLLPRVPRLPQNKDKERCKAAAPAVNKRVMRVNETSFCSLVPVQISGLIARARKKLLPPVVDGREGPFQ